MLRRLLDKVKSIPDRAHYRVPLHRPSGVGVHLLTGDGRKVAGRLVDVSAGGTAIEFEEPVADDLQRGAERELTFSSLAAAPLAVRATVRSLPSAEEPGRYGFEFTEAVRPGEGARAGLLRLFNRRKRRRARPRLDERLGVQVQLDGAQHEVTLHDISLDGASLRLPPELGLGVGSEFEFRFSVPRTAHTLHFRAAVTHVTEDASGQRAGVTTTLVQAPEGKRPTRRAFAALSDYVERRVREMERYNSAFE